MSEHDEQVKLFQLIDYHAYQYMEFLAVFAVPNGGHRHKATAARLKAEGVKAGVWDVLCPVNNGEYNGLAIEMKYGKNGLTPEQEDWAERFEYIEWKTEVHYDGIEAFNAICDYLGRPDLKVK